MRQHRCHRVIFPYIVAATTVFSISFSASGDGFTAVFKSVDVTREVKIVRINPRVDPRTRTVEVIAELANKDFLLKPGMLAEINLDDVAETAAPAEPVVPGKKAGKKAATAKTEASK